MEPKREVRGDKERLIDKYGREIRSLRFSLTNRCILNCIYCHREGESSKEKDKEISAELVIEIARVASAYFEIRRIKFSGGEPLMRSDLVEIIQGMREFEDEISVTTNGIFLSNYAADLADAGLDRVNVSLDSLRDDRYDFITRTKNFLPQVIAGIYRAIDAGLTPLKLNMVLLKGINEDEIADMVRFVQECNKRGGGTAAILQLIELIPSFTHKPLQGLQVNPYRVFGVVGAEPLHGAEPHTMLKYKADFSELEDELKSKASAIKTRELQRRRKYVVEGVEVEVVHPIDNTEFCANCSRLRITSDGKIKSCLLRNDNLVPVEQVDERHILNQLKLAMQYREPFFK